MKQRYVISACLLGISILIAASLVAENVSAQTTAATIQYPVAELGNCTDEAACRTYCDDAAHMDACLAFAEKHQLMSQDELQKARQFVKVKKGPGGCTTKASCENYCDDVSRIDECIAFAEQNGMMSANELAEAKKVQTAIAKGARPPACGGKEKCDAYCSEASHIEECIAFGKAAGLMSEQEIKDSEKVLVAIKQGVKPPACRGKEECDNYCRNAAHIEECMTFAKAAGFMSAEEAAQSEKMLQAIKKGVKPPACNGKEECETYCREESHMEECIVFSEAAGFMTSEEAAMARKTGGKGPGGCTNKEECEAFCNNPANQETCFNFGKEHGMIPEGDLKKMEEGRQQLTQTLQQAPPEVITCISGAVGSDTLEKLRSGAIMPSQNLGDKMGECFRQMMNKGTGSPGEGGSMPPQGQEESGSSRGVPGGMMIPPGQSGPGGCKNAEECRSFCESNPDACANFQPGRGPGIRIEGGREMMIREGLEKGENIRNEVRERIETMPGEFQMMEPGDEQRVPQEILKQMPEQFLKMMQDGKPPIEGMQFPNQENFVSGNITPAEMQKMIQEFRPPTATPPPGGEIIGPPPESGMLNQQPPSGGGEMPLPPAELQPPTGGILYQAFQFLLNGVTESK